MHNVIAAAALMWVVGFTPCLGNDDGLVASWRFDTAAASVPDLSGHGHAAQVSGGKLVTDGGRGAGSGRPPEDRGAFACRTQLAGRFQHRTETENLPLDRLSDARFQRRSVPVADRCAEEGGLISFFAYAGGEWEPRNHAGRPALGEWRHMVATWDGERSFVWVDGVPFVSPRKGAPPAANDSLLLIVSSASGDGIQGAIDYAKIYRRVLTPGEILERAGGAAAGPQAAAIFDFASVTDLAGWNARRGCHRRSSCQAIGRRHKIAAVARDQQPPGCKHR